MHSAVVQTKRWLEEVIIDLNFCPFAKKEWLNNTIKYHLSSENSVKPALKTILAQCYYLQQHQEVETSLIIFEQGFQNFEAYLDLLAYAEDLVISLGFEGIFQLASFHPTYCFEGEDPSDAANYTNRSPYPMIHILREESLARVLTTYNQPENIPEHNIAVARAKGSQYFETLLQGISAS